MTCSSPFKVKIPETGHIVEVPCGRCTGCRIQRSREWASRIIHEMDYFDNSIFLTITYRPEDLPSDNSLSKDVLQRFFKRLRKSLGKRRIKYFSCGEYGDKNNRPHYHAIIFGLSQSKEDRIFLEDSWPYGFLYIGNVSFQSARYVASYVLKKYNGSLASEVYGLRQPPFALMSKGLGKRFCLDNQTQLYDSLSYTIQGSKCGLPRYYRNLLRIGSSEFVSDAVARAKLVIESYDAHNITEAERSVAIAKARDFNGRTLDAKIELHNKGTM